MNDLSRFYLRDKSISIYLERLKSAENAIIDSRNGNVNISCSEIDFDEVIYAPNETVTLSANNIRACSHKADVRIFEHNFAVF